MTLQCCPSSNFCTCATTSTSTDLVIFNSYEFRRLHRFPFRLRVGIRNTKYRAKLACPSPIMAVFGPYKYLNHQFEHKGELYVKHSLKSGALDVIYPPLIRPVALTTSYQTCCGKLIRNPRRHGEYGIILVEPTFHRNLYITHPPLIARTLLKGPSYFKSLVVRFINSSQKGCFEDAEADVLARLKELTEIGD